MATGQQVPERYESFLTRLWNHFVFGFRCDQHSLTNPLLLKRHVKVELVFLGSATQLDSGKPSFVTKRSNLIKDQKLYNIYLDLRKSAECGSDAAATGVYTILVTASTTLPESSSEIVI